MGLLVASPSAYAQPTMGSNDAPLVLIVPTRGTASWLAAERRLDAELRGLQLRVAYDQVVRSFDTTLPERARAAHAMVAIQVLREADLGILRFWFTPQPGRQSGYQHLEINLRNADVVSSAVLPVVEAIFDRVEASSGEGRAPRLATRAHDGALSGDADDAPCAKNNAQRCAPLLAGRVFLGPYLASAASGASLAAGVGLRWRPLSMLALEVDADYQLLSKEASASRTTTQTPAEMPTGSMNPMPADMPMASMDPMPVDASSGEMDQMPMDVSSGLTRQTAAALHVLYEFRNRVGRGIAVGPGVGVFGASRQGEYAFVPRVSLRGEMFVPMSTRVDLAVVATGALAFGLPNNTPHGGFFTSVLLALDVHLN